MCAQFTRACTRKSTNQKLQIVAAFTAGDSDNLMVGRNGVFYDRKGQDWDATITKTDGSVVHQQLSQGLPVQVSPSGS